VGLGNPGAEHARTRHNIGFAVAEELIRRWGLGSGRERYRGRFSEGRVRAADGRESRVALLCPLTYMNDAGRAVGPARGALRLALERVLVVHDEIDLPFGEVRTRTGGGLAGHNGLKSISRALGGSGFARVRVGVGRPDSSDPEVVSSWVLGRFRESEQEVRELVAAAAGAAEQLVLGEPPIVA
jgi:PTH1 family peptidyl-tRNA hydrolase